MSSETEKYRKLLATLNLTTTQKDDLVGAVQCIVETLLDELFDKSEVLNAGEKQKG